VIVVMQPEATEAYPELKSGEREFVGGYRREPRQGDDKCVME